MNHAAFESSAQYTRRLPFIGRASLLATAAAALVGCSGPSADETRELVGEDEVALSNFARSIQNVASQKCFHAVSLSAGAEVREATCDGSNNQAFLVDTTNFSGFFRIRNTSANLCANAGVPLAPGLGLVLADCSDSLSLWNKWNRTAITGGERTSFLFPYFAAIECIDRPASSNAQLRTAPCSAANSQKFEIRVNAPPPPPPPPADPPPCASGYCCEPEGTGCTLCAPSRARCP